MANFRNHFHNSTFFLASLLSTSSLALAQEQQMPQSSPEIDALIRRQEDEKFVGQGVRNATGEAQARGGSSKDGTPAIYVWRVTNAGVSPDNIVLKASNGDNKYWYVAFNALDGTPLTSSIAGKDGWRSDEIAPGASIDITVKVVANSTNRPSNREYGSILSLSLNAASQRDMTIVDVVKTVTVVPEDSRGEAPKNSPDPTVSDWRWDWSSVEPPPKKDDPKAQGVNGANRVVKVAQRYAIHGKFDEPNIDDVSSNTIDTVDTKNNFNVSSSVQNKPTYYLGIEKSDHTLKTDAGIQWEGEANVNGTAGNVILSAGWTFFQRITVSPKGGGGAWNLWLQAKRTYPQVPKPYAKRVPKGQLGTIELFHGINASGIFTRIASFGALNAPVNDPGAPKSETIGPFAVQDANTLPSLNDISVRRVVGDTQNRGSYFAGSTGSGTWVEFDGSTVEGLHYYDGGVSAEPRQASDGASSYASWPDVDNNGISQSLFPPDKNADPDPSYVIDFKEGKDYVRERDNGSYQTRTSDENVRVMFGSKRPDTVVRSRPSYISR